MSSEEFARWNAYFTLKYEAEEKAYKQAEAKAKAEANKSRRRR